MTSELMSVLASTKEIISLPENIIETHNLINNPQNSADVIAASILKDPSLSTKILAMANSAYYGYDVDRVVRAVTILGHNQLKVLLAISMASDLFNDIGEKILSVADFWAHSSLTSIACKHLAKSNNILHPERLQVAGLLHEVGLMILLGAKKEETADIFSQARWSPTMREIKERSAFGFAQQDVGALLFETWNFPTELCQTIRHQREGQGLEAKILQTGKLIAMILDNEELSNEDILVFEANKEQLNIDLEDLSQKVHHEFEGFFKLIQPGVRRMV